MKVTPISNWMITTAHVQNKEVYSQVFVGQQFKPTFMPLQQVLAIGPRVEGVKVGDWVQINMDRYWVTKKMKENPVAGIGGKDYTKEVLEPPVFHQVGDQTTYFKITDREIEGTINDYDGLPEEMKGVITLQEFEAIQAADAAEAQKLKQEHDKEMANKKKEKKKYNKAPAIVDSTKKNVRV